MTRRRGAMAERYARGVVSADAALAQLLRGIRERLAKPPFVIVVSDHGETLDERLRERGFGYDHGEFLDAETVEIALLPAGPGIAPGRSSGTVAICDLYGSVLAIAGLAAPGSTPRDLRLAQAGVPGGTSL